MGAILEFADAATTRAKRAGKAAGKQFVSQPKTIKKKVKPYRKVI